MFMKIIRLTSHFRQRLQKPQKLRVKREDVVSTFFCSVCFGSILIPLTGEGSPWQPKSRMGVHVLLELNWTECLAPSYRIVLYEVIKFILRKKWCSRGCSTNSVNYWVILLHQNLWNTPLPKRFELCRKLRIWQIVTHTWTFWVQNYYYEGRAVAKWMILQRGGNNTGKLCYNWDILYSYQTDSLADPRKARSCSTNTVVIT